MSSAGRERGSRVGGIRVAWLAALVGLAASGCATLPSSGPITKVEEGDEGASQVQIWPSPPSEGERPAEIVGGFLEAARSGASNQRIAADYLTPAMKREWQSDQNTVIVLADYSEGLPQSPSSTPQQGVDAAQGANQSGNVPADSVAGASEGSDGSATATEQVLGTVIGGLDSSGLYSAHSGEESFDFTLELTKDGYRISQLPTDFGVLMERSDFESSYSRHVVYYENPQQPGFFVPTEMYLPSVDTDTEVAEQMAQLIVSGVPEPLAPALQDAVEHATFVGLNLDGSGEATVTIKGGAACAKSMSPCDELAEQLAQSLGGGGAKVASVAVMDESTGQSTPQHTPTQGPAGYGLDAQGHGNQTPSFYAISSTGTLETVNTAGSASEANIPFSGSDKLHFKQVAVAPDSPVGDSLPYHLALVGSDGYTVYVAHRQGDAESLTDIFPASVAPPGGTVTQPAWDSDTGEGGALWFTYTVNQTTSVYRYFGGELSQVTMTGLPPQAKIVSVAPAPDGDRVAVDYLDGEGDYTIAIAAAVSPTGAGYSVDLTHSELVAASWSSVTQFDWYDEDSLAVLGLPPSAQELGLYQLYADGSPVYDALTLQPVQASPPSQADGFVWNAAGQPVAAAVSQGKDVLYTLSVEGQDAQPLGNNVFGTSPSY